MNAWGPDRGRSVESHIRSRPGVLGYRSELKKRHGPPAILWVQGGFRISGGRMRARGFVDD